jgi:phosphate transport system permease protein
MKHFGERIVEAALSISGGITTVIIALMIVFLFREGLGFFHHSTLEEGYVLCLNEANPVETLTSIQIKQIFDGDLTQWSEVAGGDDEAIVPFRFEEIFDRYPEEALGDDYEHLPEKLAEVIAATPGILAFLPSMYVAPPAKQMNGGKLHPSDFFAGREWSPAATPAPQFGWMPLLMGTLWVSFFAILIALPLGLGVAVYLSELAGEGTRRFLKPAIELLAGIPSVVYGFFGLVVLVPFVQRALDLPVGETAFAGSLVLAIMTLPTIITLAEDAMRNTPQAMREASLGLGANQWQTICRVVIPSSVSGISAAVVLGIGRAVGETMAVLMVTGNAAVIPHSLFEPVRTIPATIAAELGEAAAGSAHYQSLFLLGCMLFALTMLISITAEMISKNPPKGIGQ